MSTYSEDEALFAELLSKAMENKLCKRCGYPMGRVRIETNQTEAGVLVMEPQTWREICVACVPARPSKK
jgi:hypothetical protein